MGVYYYQSHQIQLISSNYLLLSQMINRAYEAANLGKNCTKKDSHEFSGISASCDRVYASCRFMHYMHRQMMPCAVQTCRMKLIASSTVLSVNTFKTQVLELCGWFYIPSHICIFNRMFNNLYIGSDIW